MGKVLIIEIFHELSVSNCSHPFIIELYFE